MTEEEARDWVADRFTPEQRARLDRFAAMVADENGRQNLVSPATLRTIWARHMVDSLQLIDLAPADGAWMDIGTGGGFPGLVVGIVRDTAVHLVEPRRRRAEFLSAAADELGLPHVAVHASKVESVD
ncbi:MAG TPA: RsmG family class I SAM-dependent methyltransferase, partial [Sphingomonas sp.]